MNHQNFESRRELLKNAALAGGVVALGTLPKLAQAAPAKPLFGGSKDDKMAAPKTDEKMAKPATATGDVDILQFALGLERLEQAFYGQVLGAHQKRPYLSARMQQIASEIGANETAHVAVLEAAIIGAGATPTPAKTHKFPSQTFVSPVAFIWFAYTLEDIGIGAYLGAVGAIQSGSLRRAAASIYGAETRHASVLRGIGGWNFSPRYFESPLSVEQMSGLIAPYIS